MTRRFRRLLFGLCVAAAASGGGVGSAAPGPEYGQLRNDRGYGKRCARANGVVDDYAYAESCRATAQQQFVVTPLPVCAGHPYVEAHGTNCPFSRTGLNNHYKGLEVVELIAMSRLIGTDPEVDAVQRKAGGNQTGTEWVMVPDGNGFDLANVSASDALPSALPVLCIDELTSELYAGTYISPDQCSWGISQHSDGSDR